MDMEQETESREESFEDLPESLIGELKRADTALPLITARVDRQMTDLARDQFAGREAPSAIPAMAWMAVAAALAVAVIGLQLWQPAVQERREIYADADGSGQIDIADVLVTARREALSQAEIDAFAMRVVSLNPVGDAS